MASGVYLVTITDATGATADDSAKIENPDELTIETSSNYETCEGSEDAHAAASADGGTGGHTFLWSNGMSGYTIEGISAGEYQVTVTDENGCTAVGSQTVELSPEGVWIMTSSTDVTCAGAANGTAYVGAMTGEPPYTYLWSDPAMQTMANAVGLTAGTYYVTVTDSNGCSAVDEATIEELAGTGITVTTSSSYATCDASSDASATAEAEGGNGAHTFVWSNGMTGFKIENIPAGTYTVTVTDESGCSATATEEVELSPEGIWIMTSSTDVTCAGGADGTAHVGAMTGEPPYTYLWSDPAMQTADDAVGLTAGTYFVTVTDSNGCSAVGEVTIEEPAGTGITVTTSSSYATCDASSDASATAEAEGGEGAYTFVWSNGMTGFKIENISAGTYTVTVTDENGCSAIATEEVELSPEGIWLTISGVDVSCYGNNDGEAQVSVMTGEPPYTYLWNDPAMQTTEEAINLTPGTYMVTVTDNNGCSAVEEITITSPPEILISITTVGASCDPDGSITAEPIDGVPPYTYLWNDPVGQTTPTATGLTAGTYQVTITDASGCSETGQGIVADDCIPPCEADAGTLTIDAATVCLENGMAVVSANPNGDANIPSGYAVLFVLTSGTNQTILQTSATPSFSLSELGSYTIHTLVYDPATLDLSTVTTVADVLNLIADPAICADLDVMGATAVVEDCPILCLTPVIESVVVIEPTCGNQDGSATIHVYGNATDFTYTWTPNVSNTNVATNIGSGVYTVVIKDPSDPSCPELVETFTVANVNGPEVEVTSTTPATCQEANGTASVLPFGLEYLWCSGETGNNAVNLPAGECQITVTDPNTGCVDVIEVVIGEVNPLVADPVVVNQPDCGMANGTVNIVVSNGSFNYSFLWEDGNTMSTRSDLAAGAYRVTVTDNGATGCERIVEFVLTDNVPAAIVSVDSPVFTTCPGTNDAMVNFTIDFETGFAQPAEVTIVDDNGMVFTNGMLPAGDYCIIVKDANGCIAGGDCFEVLSPEQIDVDVAVVDGDCAMGGSITLVDAHGGNGGFTFDWLDLPGNDDPRNRNDLSPGMYSVIVSDSKGCSVLINSLVIEDDCCDNPPVISNVIVFEANCGESNGRAEIIMVGNVNDYTYSWVPSVSLNHQAINIPAGIYIVTITDINDPTCFIVHPFTVGTIDGPMATVTTTTATCDLADGTASLSPSNFEYLWSDGVSGGNRNDLSAGFYAVTVTDPNTPDCEDVITVLIEAENPLTAEVQINAIPDCGVANGSVTLVPSGGSGTYSYSWGNNATRDDLMAGAYEVIVRDVLWGCETTISFVLADNVPGVSTTITTTDVTCIGAQNGTVEYNLFLENGFVEPATVTIVQGGVEFTNGALGAGEYCLVVTDANGCVAGESCFVIGEPSQLDVDVAVVGADCNQGGTIGLVVSGSVSPYTFNWEDLPGSMNPQDRVGLMNGTYQVTITDANQCTVVIDNITVDDLCDCVPPIISSVVVVESTCGNALGRATVNLAGGPGGYIFNWEGGVSNTHQATDLVAGTYRVTITDPTDVSCSVEEVFTVGNSNGPAFDLNVIDANCGASDGLAVFSPISYSYTWSVGPSGSLRNDLSPGSYQVTIVDPSDPTCYDVQTVEIGETNSLVVDYQVDQLPNCNEANGTVTLNVSNGSGSYGYSWGADAMMNNLSAGVYTVTVTDLDTGCEQDLIFSLLNNVEQAIIQVTGIPEMTCPGANDGAIVFDLSGGYATPAVTEIRDAVGNVYTNGSLPSGSYCLVVVDANECIAGSHCFVIKEPEQLDVDIAIGPETCAELGSIELVSVTGGSGDYTYLWSDTPNPASPTSRTELNGGNYGLTLTDSNGCSVSEVLTVNDSSYMVTINLNPTDVSCNGMNDGSINGTVTNATNPLVIAWEHDATLDTLGLNDLTPAVYTVTITDANDCSSTQSVTIEEPALINLNLPADTTICDASILVVASTDVSGLTYTWTDANGTNLGSNSVLLVAPDSINFICVEVVDSLGCMEKDSIVVTNGNPMFTLEGPGTTCYGESGTMLSVNNLNASQNLTYSWSPANLIVDGINSANPTISTQTMGSNTFVVEISNQFACNATDSITVMVMDTTSIPDVITNWMCDELTMNYIIDDTTGTNYVLNFGDPMHPDSSTTDLQSSYTYSTIGNYTITLSVLGTEACMMPLEKEIEVIAPPFLTPDFDYDYSECSDSAVIVLSSNSTSAFGQIDSILWSFNNNTTATGNNATVVVNEDGQLIVGLIVINEFGCEESKLDTIDVNIIELELPDTIQTCPDSPVALNPNAAEGLVYTWTPSTYLDNPNTANPLANAPAGTVITYEVMATDSSDVCMKMDQVTLTVAPEMTNLMVSDDQFVCEDTLVTLSAFSTEASSYTWLDADNTVLSTQSTYEVNPGAVGASNMYTVELADAQGCTLSETVMLTNAAIQILAPLESPEICLGDEIALSTQAFSIPGIDLNYGWLPPSDIVSANADSSEIVVSPSLSTTYIYEVSNEYGCTNSSEMEVLVSDLASFVEATTDPDTIFRGEIAQLDATRDEGFSYEWMPGSSLNDETISNPQATPEETTDYTVMVTDDIGCSTMATVRVTVLSPECNEPFLFFPNAFTPNNDGVNDILYLRAPFEVEEVYFVIYSRWGEKMYESNSVDDGWNGTFKGKILPPDVYGFYLRVRCDGGDTYTKKGNVTLLR